MNFREFLIPAAIRLDLIADDKHGVILELVTALVQAGAIDVEKQRSVVKAIQAREEMGTTAFGHGVAIPHAKHARVDRTIAAIGISREGVDFDSLDGGKVFVFFLLLSPPHQAKVHLQALESIARQVRDRTFCRFLKQVTTVEAILDILEEADAGSEVIHT